jgi:hypothetical protein
VLVFVFLTIACEGPPAVVDGLEYSAQVQRGLTLFTLYIASANLYWNMNSELVQSVGGSCPSITAMLYLLVQNSRGSHASLKLHIIVGTSRSNLTLHLDLETFGNWNLELETLAISNTYYMHHTLFLMCTYFTTMLDCGFCNVHVHCCLLQCQKYCLYIALCMWTSQLVHEHYNSACL